MKLFIFMICLGQSLGDPASDLQTCLAEGNELNECLKITMAALKLFMYSGVPELGLPPLDPLKLENVEFNLAGVVVAFKNVTSTGLGDHQTKNFQYNKETRSIEMSLFVPKFSSTGNYTLEGKVLNVDGLDSKGPYRNEYSGVTVEGAAKIEKNGNNIVVGKMDFTLKLNKIKIHMECLFPKPGQNCCEKDKKYRSCNPIFARTIHRTINTKTGGSFVDKFQDELTGRIGDISRGFFNRLLPKVDSSYFF